MRYALISDIHANLPALEAVLADIAARGDVDATYHLGDLVGYAPWPDEVVELPGHAHTHRLRRSAGLLRCRSASMCDRSAATRAVRA